MPFFMVDDQFQANPKTHALIDMGVNGIAAIGLWTVVGSLIQAQLADGRVPASAWRQVGDRRLFNKLAKLLVQVGLWEQVEDDADTLAYHDWGEIGYAKSHTVKLKRARTKEMRNPEIVEAVKARDCDRCRYCGKKVRWEDKRGDLGGTFDHVIPGMAAGVTNLVVSCRKDNRTKAQRTPEQAGMTLLPPPNPGPETKHELDPDGASPDQVPIEKPAVPQGEGQGLGQGSGQQQVAGQVTAQVGPAGNPPLIPTPEGHTGSPWHGHRGPPGDEPSRCPTHGNPAPCRTCQAEHYRDEANP